MMYINPFIAGVMVTVFLEMAVYVIMDVYRKSQYKHVFKRTKV